MNIYFDDFNQNENMICHNNNPINFSSQNFQNAHYSEPPVKQSNIKVDNAIVNQNNKNQHQSNINQLSDCENIIRYLETQLTIEKMRKDFLNSQIEQSKII
jgi:hypothetical protein